MDRLSSLFFPISLVALLCACGDDDPTPAPGADGGADASDDAGLLDGGTPDGSTEDASLDAAADAAFEACTTVSNLDDDGDGNVDRIVTSTTTATGSVTEEDSDADGTPETRITETRDPETGVLWSRVRVRISDDKVLFSITSEFDGEDRIVKQLRDTNGDGVIERTQTWAYHDNGELKETRESRDSDVDGTDDGFTRRTYDMMGRLTYSETDDPGADTNGDAVERWQTWTYDGLASTRTDFVLGQGAVYLEETVYDEMERLVRQARSGNGDADFDDPEDSIITITWDGNVSTERSDGMGAPDGEWESEAVSTYDGDNLISQINRTRAGDVTFQYRASYDDAGNVTMEEWDDQGDDTFETVVTYTYDSNGNMLVSESRSNGDLVERQANTYDDNGFQTGSSYDADGDGNPDSTESWERDDDGRATQYERDDDGDGSNDATATYSFTCAG